MSKSKNIKHNLSVAPMAGASLGLFSLTLVAGTIGLNTTTTSADTSFTDDVSITVSAVCNIASTLDTAHTATITPGLAFTENIGTTNVSATCNDSDGYSIYAVGYTGDTIGNTNLEGTDTGNTGISIATRNYDSSYTDTSYWSMKLTAGQGTDAATIIDSPINYSNYVAVPNAYDKVATKTSATTGSSEASFTTTYGAYATTTQTAGSYAGKVKYTLVHPNTAPAPFVPHAIECDTSNICYQPNADPNEVTDTMGDQSIADTDTSADLWASNFQRPGYGFAGWNTEPDYSGTSYGPNETISFTAGQYSGSNPGLSLYAIWIPSAGDLQSWTGCSALTKANEVASTSDILTQSLTALTDTRDNNTYAVAKLADGNCWMIENLRLDNEHTTSAADIAKAQAYNPSFIGLADPENTLNWNNSTTANSLYSTDGSTTAPAITGSNQSYRFPRYNNQNTATPATNMISWGNSTNTYSVGNWYTWPAAIADTSNYTTNNQTIANTSICPIGWKLPSGGQTTINTTANYYVLTKTIMNNQEPDQDAIRGYGYYGNSVTNSAGKTATQALRGYPNNFLYSGYFVSGSAYDRGSYGLYWSSTVTAYSTSSYYLGLDSSSVYPGTNNYGKFNGSSIRCLAGT